MKKLLAVLLLTVSASAMAQHGFRHYHHGGYYGGYGYGWVAPTIIGGVIGYEIARTQSPIIVQQPVIVQQQPTINYGQTQICTEWKEVQTSDGKIYRERTCTQ